MLISFVFVWLVLFFFFFFLFFWRQTNQIESTRFEWSEKDAPTDFGMIVCRKREKDRIQFHHLTIKDQVASQHTVSTEHISNWSETVSIFHALHLILMLIISTKLTDQIQPRQTNYVAIFSFNAAFSIRTICISFRCWFIISIKSDPIRKTWTQFYAF